MTATPADSNRRAGLIARMSILLGLLAALVLAVALLLAGLVTAQIQVLNDNVQRNEGLADSNLRALAQTQREILRLSLALDPGEAAPETIDLLRAFVSQRTQEVTLPYQIATFGNADAVEVSVELRARWVEQIEPLVREIIDRPDAAADAREQATAALQELEQGYNQLAADSEINRRLETLSLIRSARSTLEATQAALFALALSATAFLGLTVLSLIQFSRLSRERETAAEALVAANHRLEMLSAVASRTRNQVIITDPKGRIEWVNDAFESTTGYTLEEVRGKYPGGFLQGQESNPDTIRYMSERVRAGLGFEVEIVNYSKDGREYWIAIEAQPTFDDEGQLASFVAIQTDITARRQAEAALRAALEHERETRELKSRFVTMTSHEFRTPLTTILTLADFLKIAEGTMTPQQRADRLDRIIHAARHISSLMDEVLLYDRADAAWLQFTPQPVELISLVRDVVTELETETQRRFDTHLPDQPLTLQGDPILLRQIAGNLLGNALKYSPAEKPVEVSLQVAQECAVFTVRDHGIGIPLSEQARIFTPFYRATNTDGVAGAGLGLAITRNAVEVHHGSITFESASGAGTTFIVRLPLEGGTRATE